MTSTTGKLRRLTFRGDQAAVPAPTRVDELTGWARVIADNTDPAQHIDLQAEDRLLLAMALPNLPDDRAQSLLVAMVGELHAAEQAEQIDPREAGYVPAETYRDSAAQLARDAVNADLQAGAESSSPTGPRVEPCGCRWIETWDSNHEGGDLEKLPCERHRVVVDLDELRRTGWQDLQGGGF